MKVTIDNRTIDGMIRDPKFTEPFPFLKTTFTADPKCPPCAKRRRGTNQPVVNYEQIKRQLATMTAANRQQLKGLFGASQVIIRYADGKKVQVVTL